LGADSGRNWMTIVPAVVSMTACLFRISSSEYGDVK
jgi:hypothetical protein